MFQPFVLKARAKVNLALHVLGRRADGYHDLDSIVAFADAGDELRFAPADAVAITASGPFADALPAAGENIVARAWQAAMEIAAMRGKSLPPVAVHLTKNLPVASGIGGGSSNAAAALRGFLRIAGIDLADDAIMARALAIGADVPVCLVGRACRMQGIGERITPLEAFDPVSALLVNPGFSVPTPEVFRQLGLGRGQNHGTPIDDLRDPASWRNDLAAPAIALQPAIGEVIAWLERQSAVSRAFMSGSGATCVGILRSSCEIGPLPENWWMATTALR